MPRVPVPFSDYSDTRLDANEQQCINIYPHSKGGLRQFPGSTAIDVSLTGISLDSSNQNLARLKDTGGVWGFDVFVTRGLRFSPDGTKAILLQGMENDTDASFTGNATFRLLSIRLDSPWDLSSFDTSDYSRSTDYYFDSTNWTGGGVPRGIAGCDGTNLILTAESKLLYYTLSTEWSAASATYVDDFDLGYSATGDVVGGAINEDASKVYVVSDTNSAVYQYSLSTAWNVSTATKDAAELDYSGQSSAVQGMGFFQAGEKVVLGDDTNNRVLEYSLASAYDLTSETYEQAVSVSSETTDPAGLVFGKSDTRLYLGGGSSNLDLHQYSLSSADRGAWLMGDLLYFVRGTSLFSLNSSGTVTSISGTVAGSQRCIFDTDGTQLVICAGANQYVYTVAGGLVEITDGDLASDCNSAAYLDSRFYFEQGSQFYASALGDATDINALDVASAESFSDDIVRLLTVDQLLYIFGERSIEIWYSSGTGRPPVDRQEVVDEVGLIGRYAIGVIDNTIYFLDEQRRLNRMRGAQFEAIYIPALGSEWQNYTTFSDAIINAYSFNQENFIEINFPTEDASWTYHEVSGRMISRQDSNGSRFNLTTYAEAFGNLYGVEKDAGIIYEFSEAVYQDGGSGVTRSIDTQLMNSELYGTPGREMIVNGIFPTFEASGSGTVTVSISKDGGAFGNSRTLTVSSGTKRYEGGLSRWGKCRECVFRFTTTSNIKLDFISLDADVELLND